MARSIDNGLKKYNFEYSHTAQSHSEYTTELTRRNSGTYTALHMLVPCDSHLWATWAMQPLSGPASSQVALCY